MKALQSFLSFVGLVALVGVAYYFWDSADLTRRLSEHDRKIDSVSGQTEELKGQVTTQGAALRTTQLNVDSQGARLEVVEKRAAAAEAGAAEAAQAARDAQAQAARAEDKAGKAEQAAQQAISGQEQLQKELGDERRERLRQGQVLEQQMKEILDRLGPAPRPAP